MLYFRYMNIICCRFSSNKAQSRIRRGQIRVSGWEQRWSRLFLRRQSLRPRYTTAACQWKVIFIVCVCAIFSTQSVTARNVATGPAPQICSLSPHPRKNEINVNMDVKLVDQLLNACFVISINLLEQKDHTTTYIFGLLASNGLVVSNMYTKLKHFVTLFSYYELQRHSLHRRAEIRWPYDLENWNFMYVIWWIYT